MHIVVFAALIGLVIGLLYYWLTKTYTFWDDLNVVTARPQIFFGNLKENIMGRKFLAHSLADVYRQFPKEKYVGAYTIRTPVLVVRDLDLLKQVLIKDFDCFSSRGVKFSKEALGANIFHADSDTWNVLRKRFTPMFTSGKMKNMFYLVDECANSFIEFADSETNGDEDVNIYNFTARYTTSVICACAFGLDAKTMTDEYNIFLDFGDRIFTPSWKVFLETIFPGSFKRFNLSFFDKDVNNFFNNLVKNIVKEREGKPKTRQDFMDLLVEMKEQGQVVGNRVKSSETVDLVVTEEVMAAQALVFFAAGFETSASTMEFMLYEMARNQDIQDKVVEEIESVLEKYNGKVTYESLNELNYLGMVMSETLRKFPIVDPMQREAVVNYKVPDTNLTIPKGTLLFIPANAIHMDPEHWPNPETFDPERFSQEREKDRHPMAFQAFGQGPRMCIGNRFAKLVIFVGMTYFFEKFRVFSTERTPQHLEYNANRHVLQPKQKIHIRIKRKFS